MNYPQLLDFFAHNDVILGIERKKYQMPKISILLELLHKSAIAMTEMKERFEQELEEEREDHECDNNSWEDHEEELIEKHNKEVEKLQKEIEELKKKGKK